MKMEREISGRCCGTEMKIFCDGDFAAECCADDVPLLRFGRVRAGGFDEAQGLPEKLRRHAAHDGLSVEADSEHVIPFGCEYRITRHWDLFGGVAMLTEDVRADHGGRIAELELEPVFFPGAAVKVEFLVYGEAAFRTVEHPVGELYRGVEPLVMTRVVFASGAAAEFYAGDDIWRHRGGLHTPGASTESRLSADTSGVTLKRLLLSLPGEIVPEKRPWRVKSLISVRSANDSAASSRPEHADVLRIDGCFGAAAAHRELRAFVRKSSGSVTALTGAFPGFCSDGAHSARPGKTMEHGDLGELAVEWLWGNREMRRRDGAFIILAESKIFDGSIALKRMSSPLAPLENGGTENK